MLKKKHTRGLLITALPTIAAALLAAAIAGCQSSPPGESGNVAGPPTPAGAASAQQDLDRTILPIQEPKPPTYTELDARNLKAPPLFEVKAPEEAPNVVIVLIDDLGFGAPSTFGGPLQTPTFDRLAEGGLRYNNFTRRRSVPRREWR
jgi:hypothetical protein